MDCRDDLRAFAGRPSDALDWPDRKSPMANTPGTEDSSCEVVAPSFVRFPVVTKPDLSIATPQPCSHSVAGSAPMNKKTLPLYAAEDALHIVRRRLDGICAAHGQDTVGRHRRSPEGGRQRLRHETRRP